MYRGRVAPVHGRQVRRDLHRWNKVIEMEQGHETYREAERWTDHTCRLEDVHGVREQILHRR